VTAIYNENPSAWQQLILDSDSAFEQLLNQAKLNNLQLVAELLTKGKKAQATKSSKKKAIEKATVGKPSGKTKEIPSVDFNKLDLKGMEQALPKVDE